MMVVPRQHRKVFLFCFNSCSSYLIYFVVVVVGVVVVVVVIFIFNLFLLKVEFGKQACDCCGILTR